MKALLITPDNQSIEIIDITHYDDIVRLIGFDTIISDEISKEGDRLFFDEDCFLRGSSGRFQIDSLIPVSGKGVIIGSDSHGVELHDMVSDIDDVKSRIKYL